MMFSLTPMVPQTASPSRHSMTTRTLAVVLEVLYLIKKLGHHGPIVRQGVLPGLGQDGRLTGQLTDQDAPLVAYRRGVHVLVAGRVASDGVRMHAAFVGEGAGADERLR